ncbi:MAG: hypothetical protein ACPGGB_02735, partial [Flavobacteriales bacterium]
MPVSRAGKRSAPSHDPWKPTHVRRDRNTDHACPLVKPAAFAPFPDPTKRIHNDHAMSNRLLDRIRSGRHSPSSPHNSLSLGPLFFRAPPNANHSPAGTMRTSTPWACPAR